jgi:hypothetical protein
MNYLINAMATYEVYVANYYYRRGAYLAALNRAMGAVHRLPRLAGREEALFIMIRSYDKLGMFDLRDDAQRVFKQNYPNSRFLGKGTAMRLVEVLGEVGAAGAEGCGLLDAFFFPVKTPAKRAFFVSLTLFRQRRCGGTPTWTRPNTHSSVLSKA